MPGFDTPQRLPLVSTIQSRDFTASKDARMINCYAELDPTTNEYWVEKRPGVKLLITPPNNLGGGVFQSASTGSLYIVAGNNIFEYIGPVTNTNLGALPGGVGYRPFTFLDTPTPNRLYISNGGSAGFVAGTSHVLTNITDVNYPAATVPGAAYLDGTLYVMDTVGNIWNSALNDISNWTPATKIVANSEAGVPKYLGKQLVYVVAFKSNSVEFFYDAANASGSPLSGLPGVKLDYGCVSGSTVQQLDGTFIWLGNYRGGNPQIIRMDNLQPSVISTPAVERLLANSSFFSSFQSYVYKIAGHRFYALGNLGTVNTILNNYTLAYDLDQQLWYLWNDATGAALPFGSTTYSPIPFTAGFSGQVIQNFLNSKVYQIEADFVFPTDDGVIFPVDIYTQVYDAGIDRSKTCSRLRFNGNQVPGSILQSRYSDNDYQTYSPFEQVDLSLEEPFLTDQGEFRRRSYNFRHQSDTALRLRSADLQLDLGTL